MGAAALLGVDRGSMSRDTDRYAGRERGGSWRYGECLGGVCGDVGGLSV